MRVVRTIIKLVLVCAALVVNLVLLAFAIWQVKKKPDEVVFWPMIVSWIVTIVNIVIQIVL